MHRSSISVIVLINFILAASAGRHQRGNANDVSCDECGGQYFPSQEDSSTFISPDHEVKRSLLQKEIAKAAPNTLHIYVRTSAQLRAALLAAAPGHVIHVAPGKYAGQTRFTLQNKRDLPGRPIIITGPPSAIIAEASPSWAVFPDQKSRQANTSASNRSRYQRYDEDYYGQAALTLRNVSHVKVYGLTLTGSRLGVVLRGANDCLVQGVRVQRIQSSGIACERCTRVTITKCTLNQVWRGVVLDYSTKCKLSHLRVSNTANCGLKLRRNSTENTITRCLVTDTGKVNRGFGEGIYVGSAYANSFFNVNGKRVFKPDRSDYNILTFNILGPRVTAEMIDIKPHTTRGLVANNTLDGRNIALGVVGADSWMAINGNGWTIRGNVGRNTPGDGFATRVVPSDVGLPSARTGYYNLFERNICATRVPNNRHCININNFRQRTGHGNAVRCNNVAVGGARASNVYCGDGLRKKVGKQAHESESPPLGKQKLAEIARRDAAVEEEESHRDDPPPEDWLQKVFPIQDDGSQ